MPKANHGGATAAGMEGIVEHGAPLADGRVLSELDPERNLDGTLIEGEHPDHEDGEERETTPVSDPRPLEPVYADEDKADEQAGPDARHTFARADKDSSSAKETAKPSDVKPPTAARSAAKK